MIDNAKPIEGATVVYVKPYGKKVKATYCFTSRQISKILSMEQFAELKANPSYRIA
jgi:hypothetical protein